MIEITVKAEIFDDPEFCNDKDANGCQYVDEDRKECNLFLDGIIISQSYYSSGLYCKCGPCKTEYKDEIDRTDPVKIQERKDDDFFDDNYS